MKKTWIILLAGFLFACNNSGGDKDSADKTTNSTADTTPKTPADQADPQLPKGITKADYEKGLSLIAGSDCLTCHQINQKLTGPAYADIANKYEPTKENITMLAGKIIKGGSGVWGQVPMTPHDGMPQEEAEAMAKYVLSLRNLK